MAATRQLRGVLAGLVVALPLLLVALLYGGALPGTFGGSIGRPTPAMHGDAEPRPSPLSPTGGVFSARSIWKQDVRGAPLDPDSRAMVAGLARQVRDNYGGSAAFNNDSYNTTFYVVSENTPRQDVRFDDCQNKGYIPSQLYEQREGAHFRSIPIPSSAVPATGTDAEMTVWLPATDQLWELWRARQDAEGWHACWGGRMDGVSKSPGFFANPMGATATGLPNAGGMVGIREALAGRVDHALSLQLIETDAYDVVSYPAQRSDGDNPDHSPDRIAEGQRLRLDPGVDVDSLHLHPLAAMIAKAAQTYGFVVTDKSGSVAVLGESGAADQAASGSDPWRKLLRGTRSDQVMSRFPWSSLQVLVADWGRPTG